MEKNEAIKIIRSNYPTGRNQLCEALETLIPELKESEDEEIRHYLIDFVKINDGVNIPPDYAKKALAWLEKQGEKKSTSPVWKYKKDHTPLVRDSLILNKYGYVSQLPYGAPISDVWVIDYDELAKLPKEEIEKQGHTDSIIEKAKTEKQRVIITETDGNANIDWDTRSLEDARRLLECGLQYINTELEKQNEQKPALSEEDENLYTRYMSAIRTFYIEGLFTINVYKQMSRWLESIKERSKGE